MKRRGKKRTWLPQSRRARALLISSVVAVMVGGGLAAAWGAGVVGFPRLEALFAGTAEKGGGVVVVAPGDGAHLIPGDIIEGHVEASGQVYVWVQGVNFAVPAQMEGDRWTFQYRGGLDGGNTLVFSLIAGGRWGPTTEVRYIFGDEEDQTVKESTPGLADKLPAPLRMVFRPIENVVKQAAAFVERLADRAEDGARGSSGDLDGNGVPDRWQGSPTSPADGFLGRVPYANLLIVVVLPLTALLAVYGWKSRDIHAHFERRSKQKLQERAMEARMRQEHLRLAAKLRARQLAAQERVLTKRLDATARLTAQQLKARESVAKKRLGAVEQIHRGRQANQTLRFRILEKLRRRQNRGDGDGV